MQLKNLTQSFLLNNSINHILLDKLQVPEMSKYVPLFTTRGCSLFLLQHTATYTYAQPEESNSRPPNRFFQDPFCYYPLMYPCVIQVISVPSGFSPKPCMPFPSNTKRATCPSQPIIHIMNTLQRFLWNFVVFVGLTLTFYNSTTLHFRAAIVKWHYDKNFIVPIFESIRIYLESVCCYVT